MIAAEGAADEVVLVALTLPYPPVTGNAMARHTRAGGHYPNPRYVEWRNEVHAACVRQFAGRPIEAPCGLIVRAHPPDRRARDADNVLKVLGDALVAAGVISDDSNRILRAVALIWGDPVKGGRLEVRLVEVAA